MNEIFDLSKFDEYKEDNRREVKSAEGGLPQTLWDTYSSMANTYGGVIICGVKERNDGTWFTTGMKAVSEKSHEVTEKKSRSHEKKSRSLGKNF